MKAQLAQLKEFHTKFNSLWQDTPALVGDGTRDLRARLIQEETKEVIEAMEEGNVEHIAKELADLLYTVYGTIGSYGLSGKMPEIFTEVHNSNMSKDVPEGGEGKAIKGKNYREADITSILQK